MREGKEKTHKNLTNKHHFPKDKTEPEMPIDQVPLSHLKVPQQSPSSEGDSYSNPPKNFLCRAGLGPAAPVLKGDGVGGGWDHQQLLSHPMEEAGEGAHMERKCFKCSHGQTQSLCHTCKPIKHQSKSRGDRDTTTPTGMVAWGCSTADGRHPRGPEVRSLLQSLKASMGQQ